MVIGTNIYTAIGLFGTCSMILLGLFSTYPAVNAFNKGRSFVKWYMFSFLLFPVALVMSLVIQNKKNVSM